MLQDICSKELKICKIINCEIRKIKNCFLDAFFVLNVYFELSKYEMLIPEIKPELAAIKSGKPNTIRKSLNTKKFTIVFKLPTNIYFVVFPLFLKNLTFKIFKPVFC